MDQSGLKHEILEAIGAHGAWKMRLRSAAAQGETDLPVADIRSDDHCRFGKWLKTLSAEVSQTEEARNVAELHRQFHLQAGAVAQKICDGDSQGALKDLADAEFSEATKALTTALTNWKAQGV